MKVKNAESVIAAVSSCDPLIKIGLIEAMLALLSPPIYSLGGRRRRRKREGEREGTPETQAGG